MVLPGCAAGPVVGPSQGGLGLVTCSTNALASATASCASAGPATRPPPAASATASGANRTLDIWVGLPWLIVLSCRVRCRGVFGLVPGDAAEAATLALSVPSEADCEQERHAVEQGLDVEDGAQLLNARDADRQDRDANDGAPHVDPARLDRGRTEKGPDQGWEQELETDARLPDAQLGR